MQRLSFALAICGLAGLLSGCAAGYNTTGGTILGAGLGAFTGAAIGDHTGHAGGGALIGAATGAVAGGLLGNAEDAREERDAAVAQAHYERAAHEAHERAMKNADIVLMSQNGVSDDVIISSVNNRGGLFDLSPAGIIHLKNNGISDRVILAVQSAASPPPPGLVRVGGPYPPVPVTEIYVAPRPVASLGVMIGPGRPPYGPPPRHWHH